jgi:hypothetical protein
VGRAPARDDACMSAIKAAVYLAGAVSRPRAMLCRSRSGGGSKGCVLSEGLSCPRVCRACRVDNLRGVNPNASFRRGLCEQVPNLRTDTQAQGSFCLCMSSVYRQGRIWRRTAQLAPRGRPVHERGDDGAAIGTTAANEATPAPTTSFATQVSAALTPGAQQLTLSSTLTSKGTIVRLRVQAIHKG